jgi:hypothetical protein
MSYAPQSVGNPTVIVVEQPSAITMDRSNYAGDFTLSRSQVDCTQCGKQRLENGENFLVCNFNKCSSATCFWQEHPDMIIKAMDIGEISPIPRQEKTTTVCYCCCYQLACMGPNHDLFIEDSSCLCMKGRSECNVGEAEAMYKCNGTSACCDFQKPEVGTLSRCAGRQDLGCMCQRKFDSSCDFTCHSICKGQTKNVCMVTKYALPTDDDVPCGIGCFGIMCCGGQPVEEEQPQENTVVVVQN